MTTSTNPSLSPFIIHFRGGLFLAMVWLALSAAQAQTTNYALGTTNLLVGPAAGSSSVVLAVTPATGTWTATTNSTWLHLSLANQSGTGSTNVIFSYDSNPGSTRSGTLTIAGQTLTITQAGSTYVPAGAVTPLVSTDLSGPYGVAVDNSGNVYIADVGNGAIKEWMPSNNAVVTLVSSNSIHPEGLAVDDMGNVYFSATTNNEIMEWTPGNSNLTTLVSSGLRGPVGVAVDAMGNVYIADNSKNAIQEWMVANTNLVTLVSSGLFFPSGVAVDAAGNVYIANSGDGLIEEWTAANTNVSTIVSSGLDFPAGVAVDGAGNVYIADTLDGAIKEWTAASNSVKTLDSSNLLVSAFPYPIGPMGVAVDGAGNVYIADTGNNAIKELPYAFVDPTPRWESLSAGSDALPVVLPASQNLLAPFTPTTDQPWLTINSVTNGVVSFSFSAATSSRVAHILLLGQSIPVVQGSPAFSLGSTECLEGPNAGIDGVILAVAPSFTTWTASSAASWLHLSQANQIGTGSTNVVFGFDANQGSTRIGSLMIGGQTLTVTQAASTYVEADPVTTLVSSGLLFPYGVAVDAAGNVYIADSSHSAIKEWMPESNTVTTLLSAGLQFPHGLAVDSAGNVYIADTLDGAIKELPVGNSNAITLVSSGLNYPESVAVDGAGNVYIADSHNNAIKKRSVATGVVSALVSSGLSSPYGVAVDASGNVYIADTGNNVIKKWTAANSNLSTLVSSGLNSPRGVAVDGSGNVYIADYENNAVYKWTVANNVFSTLASSGLNQPSDVAVDSSGNVYIADTYNYVIKELPYAFVDKTPRLENLAANSDSLPEVLPSIANQRGPFAPFSDQHWLTITGITNGVLDFAVTAAASNRTGNITMLGQIIPITQGGPNYCIGTTNLLVGSSAANASVVLAALPYTATWTNTANAPWLHLNPANQSGSGSTNVIFSFDANPGATRSATLTIASKTVTVTQASSTYVAARPLTTLVSSGLNPPWGVAVDGSGNVFLADWTIKEWTVTNNTLSTLVPLAEPDTYAVVVDGAGVVYVPDGTNLLEWASGNSNITTLEWGLDDNVNVAVDGEDNVYIASEQASTILEWTGTNGSVITLVSAGLSGPLGIAVDGAGNVYVPGNGGIQEWIVANNTLCTLVPSGLVLPEGLAVDGGGNIYIADASGNSIKEWTAANSNLDILVSSGLDFPVAVAVDNTGNVYIADNRDVAIKELPYAFVDPTPKLEGLAAGNDVLPTVLPATENLLPPFAPNSDQSWLAVDGATNGVVSFSFTANTGPARTAHITLLGQVVPVTQGVVGTPTTLSNWQVLATGAFQFSFTNTPSAVFTVLSSTDLTVPVSNWTVVGAPVEAPPGVYQFTSQATTNAQQCFYTVCSP